jgi:hypothetical protein
LIKRLQEKEKGANTSAFLYPQTNPLTLAKPSGILRVIVSEIFQRLIVLRTLNTT